MPESTLGVPVGFDREALETAGYIGWRSWQQLRESGLGEVPRASGCYVVQRQRAEPPTFAAESPAGHFKGKDPTVPHERMQAEWVAGASTVYIGKANDLRTRLKAYARFGAGEPVAHWGGRLIWQLDDAAELLVAWRALTSPAPLATSSGGCWTASPSFTMTVGRWPTSWAERDGRQGAQGSAGAGSRVSSSAARYLAVVAMSVCPRRRWRTRGWRRARRGSAGRSPCLSAWG